MHRAVACGLEHTVCITAKDILSWGSNEYGQLGHGEHALQVRGWGRGRGKWRGCGRGRGQRQGQGHGGGTDRDGDQNVGRGGDEDGGGQLGLSGARCEREGGACRQAGRVVGLRVGCRWLGEQQAGGMCSAAAVNAGWRAWACTWWQYCEQQQLPQEQPRPKQQLQVRLHHHQQQHQQQQQEEEEEEDCSNKTSLA